MTVALVIEVARLMTITEKAVRVHQKEAERREASDSLNSAYNSWKHENGVEHVERDTLEWVQMMHSTRNAYEHLTRAKNRERHARKALSDAIARSGLADKASL